MAEPAVARLRERLAPLTDLTRLLDLLHFDQETIMPPAGSTARGHQTATVEALVHDAMCSPELAELLDAALAEDLQGEDAALVRLTSREVEKARRVPTELVREITLAAADGQAAWVRARQDDDFASFRPFLERNVELRRRYAACFDAEEPYDALLDDFEPGLRTADLVPVFDALRAELPGLVAEAAAHSPGQLRGRFPIEAQHRVVADVLRRIGFDEECWRIAEAVHPFSATPGRGDNRITTRYDQDSLESVMCALHEFGHGLYEAQIDPALARSPLGRGTSMGVHESQSRLWEVFVGMSLPFWRGAWHELCDAFGGPPNGLDPEGFVAALASVTPTPIRVESDPVSYPLHIIVRFDLELALLSGGLGVADLPAAWNDAMRELLGVTVPDDAHGVLQDVHWSAGAIGYFPTYALGTMLAAQIWEVARGALGDLDAQLEAGDLAPLRDWLRETVHRHGSCLTPTELVESATGRGLDPEPYLAFARTRASGALPR